jgi:hypothetical protein
MKSMIKIRTALEALRSSMAIVGGPNQPGLSSRDWKLQGRRGQSKRCGKGKEKDCLNGHHLIGFHFLGLKDPSKRAISNYPLCRTQKVVCSSSTRGEMTINPERQEKVVDNCGMDGISWQSELEMGGGFGWGMKL